MDYRIYCPSYKRGNLATSHKLFNKDKFSFVVKESEAKNYEHLGYHILKIPDHEDGTIAKARNWILRNKISEKVLMVDDDLKSFNWIIKRKSIAQNPDQIHNHIINGFTISEDVGSGIWGVNVQNDPMFYRISTPLSFSQVVLGPFLGILDTTISFDENLPLKEILLRFIFFCKESILT